MQQSARVELWFDGDPIGSFDLVEGSNAAAMHGIREATGSLGAVPEGAHVLRASLVGHGRENSVSFSVLGEDSSDNFELMVRASGDAVEGLVQVRELPEGGSAQMDRCVRASDRSDGL